MLSLFSFGYAVSKKSIREFPFSSTSGQRASFFVLCLPTEERQTEMIVVERKRNTDFPLTSESTHAKLNLRDIHRRTNLDLSKCTFKKTFLRCVLISRNAENSDCNAFFTFFYFSGGTQKCIFRGRLLLFRLCLSCTNNPLCFGNAFLKMRMGKRI